MRISDIYQKYKIPPQLQIHQLRVAAVGKMIAENMTEDLIDEDNVVVACLLHDMGNIIKFDFSLFPEFLQPEGLEYWQGVKEEFIGKYGTDEHEATDAIAREIGVNNHVLEIIGSLGFSKSKHTYQSDNYGLKIVAYSDQRVTPYGIGSLQSRLDEAKKRYVANKSHQGLKRDQKPKKAKWSLEVFEELRAYAMKVEKQILAKCKIKPDDINDDSVRSTIENLRAIEISTS